MCGGLPLSVRPSDRIKSETQPVSDGEIPEEALVEKLCGLRHCGHSSGREWKLNVSIGTAIRRTYADKREEETAVGKLREGVRGHFSPRPRMRANVSQCTMQWHAPISFMAQSIGL